VMASTGIAGLAAGWPDGAPPPQATASINKDESSRKRAAWRAAGR
jgi:hypothetical protein